jgi:hypothetical protein
LNGLRSLTVARETRKRTCMTRIVSFRMPAQKVAAVDRRAADAGLDRTRYLLQLVEQDLARTTRKTKRRFASSHLLGRFRSTGSSNPRVRAALKAQSEKDR